VTQLSPTRVKLTIEMSFDELQPAIDKAYKEISGQVNIPGFRKGKIPKSLIDQRYGRGAVLQEAINATLPDAYSKAVTENAIVPLGQPEIDVTKLEDGDVVEFSAEVDVRPDFEMPDFSAISVEVPVNTVPQETVDERLNLLRERFATYTEVDRAAKDGDTVIIDLTASQNGETMADTEAHGLSYEVGSGTMLDGLDKALKGLKAGKEKSFDTTLVGGSHQGEEAQVTVKLDKVQERELPAVDDDFAQLVSEYDTVDEMLAGLREGLENMAKIDQINTARDKVLDEVIEKTEFELPEGLVDREVEARKDEITNQLATAGLTIEDYLAQTQEESTKDPEEFWKNLAEQTEKSIRAQIILDKLADDTQVGVTQEDLTELLIQKAQQSGTTPEQEANHRIEHNHMPEWMGEIRRSKALGAIVAQTKVTDTDGNAVELPNPAAEPEAAEEAEPVAEEPKPKKTKKAKKEDA
jgi:trigger factor